MDTFAATAPRRAFRVPLRVETAASQGERPRFIGYAGDLSVTGVFVQSTRPRTPGERVDLCIYLPDPVKQAVMCVGEVVWTRGYRGAVHPAPGMGIRFVAIEAEGVEALARFCAEHPAG